MIAIQNKKKSIIEDYLTGETYTSCNRLLFTPFDHDDVKAGRYKKLAAALHPCSTKYTAPIVPLNLFEIVNVSYLNLFPVVLVRDGLFSLIDFFHRNPDPKEIKTLLIINEQFLSFVPCEWSTQILFYKKVLTENQNYSKREENFILVKGIMSKSFFSMEFLKEQLDFLKKTDQQVLFFTPEREDFFMEHDWVKNPFCYEVLQQIFTTLNMKAEMITWTDLQGINKLEEGRVLDLNESLLGYNDDYLDHHLVARSCFPIDQNIQKIADKGYFIPYSFYHGISLFDEGNCGSLVKEIDSMKTILKVPKDKILSKDFCVYIVDLAKKEKIKNVWYRK